MEGDPGAVELDSSETLPAPPSLAPPLAPPHFELAAASSCMLLCCLRLLEVTSCSTGAATDGGAGADDGKDETLIASSFLMDEMMVMIEGAVLPSILASFWFSSLTVRIASSIPSKYAFFLSRVALACILFLSRLMLSLTSWLKLEFLLTLFPPPSSSLSSSSIFAPVPGTKTAGSWARVPFRSWATSGSSSSAPLSAPLRLSRILAVWRALSFCLMAAP
mmetsp:Transcript_10232/g.20399  ORF Transcript_10232/g.20399 Transcript_10232/m.20399 type:complete len:220 (-) Transcript_10232:168-827(-)